MDKQSNMRDQAADFSKVCKQFLSKQKLK